LDNWLKIGVLVAIFLIPLFTVPVFGQGIYTNKLYDFSIIPPESWKTFENLEAVGTYQPVQVGFHSQDYFPSDVLIPHIAISFENVGEYEDPFVSNEDILKYFNERLRWEIPSAKVISQDIQSKSWGWIVKNEIVFTQEYDYGFYLQTHTEQFSVLFKDGEAYTIGYFATDDYYDKYYTEFKKSLETFEVRGIKLFLGSTTSNGGCLIATATFGSELAPQVQLLREIRDNSLLQTQSGQSFMQGFNQFYYSFSPAVANYERQNPVFKEAVKLTITPLLVSLSLLNYVDLNSEESVLGYGIGIILMNVGMYFVAPALLVIGIYRKHKPQYDMI